MRVLLQRVSKANVSIGESICDEIGRGLLLLVSIAEGDSDEDIQWLCRKIVPMRIFNDSNGKMNYSLADVGGDVLVVSQFTLHASTKKGNRPSYTRSAPPAIAVPLYEQFVRELEKQLHNPVSTGQFGANMKVSLVNDGPVTIMMDSKNRE